MSQIQLPEQQQKKIYPLQRNDKNGSSSRIVLPKKRKTLVIGWNLESLRLYDKIKEYPALHYDVKGFLSVRNNGSR